MVFVDFSNPYLRSYLAGGYLAAHERRLQEIADQLEAWAAQSAQREKLEAAERAAAARPLAAVLDIDEVLLSNIHMNSFAAAAGVQGAQAVDFHAADVFSWPRGARLNPALPGALALLRRARQLGLALFFVTGRLEAIRDETVENFEAAGFAAAAGGEAPLATAELRRRDGPLRMCPDAEAPAPGESVRPYKEGQRRAIAERHRIVLVLGDQVSDLGLHGDVQFLLPHPFYYIP